MLGHRKEGWSGLGKLLAWDLVRSAGLRMTGGSAAHPCTILEEERAQKAGSQLSLAQPGRT